MWRKVLRYPRCSADDGCSHRVTICPEGIVCLRSNLRALALCGLKPPRTTMFLTRGPSYHDILCALGFDVLVMLLVSRLPRISMDGVMFSFLRRL